MLKIIRTSTIPDSLYILLKGQLNFLNKYFEILAISGNGAYLTKTEVREGIRVYPINISRRISLFKDFVALFRLVQCFKKERPFIVHSITPKAGLLSMVAAYIAGVPVRIHTFTGLIFPTKRGAFKLLLILMDKILCMFATHIYPEGEGVKRELIHYKITSKPLKVIANGNINGIDLNYYNAESVENKVAESLKLKYNIKADNFIFIFIGRVVKDKGVNELIWAFKKIYQNSTKCRLLIVGSMENEDDQLLKEDIYTIRNHSGIIFIGFQEDVRPFLKLSHVLILPSYREGFPNVVLEAGSMGLPSIVTDINGSNEIIINLINGLIVPSRNKKKLFDAMTMILNDVDLFNKLKNKARELIESRYQQEIVWNGILQEYLKAIQ